MTVFCSMYQFASTQDGEEGRGGFGGELGVRAGIESFSNRQVHGLGRYRSKRQGLQAASYQTGSTWLLASQIGKGSFLE